MTTNNRSINISRENVSGKCDLKCAYNFKYTQSNSTAKNNGVNITLTYDNTSVPPVLYNNQPYIVSNVVINCPSVHYFNGSQIFGEITIEHSPVKGGPNLYVCIPINSSTESSDATIILDEIIESVATNAPVEGETTNLNLSNYNLQNIVPNKPFYSYTDAQNTEWIVFGILYAIPLNSNTLNTLSQIIKPYPIPMQGGPLFYNSSGPNSGTALGDGIYIKCNPTGSSKEEVPVEYSKNTPSYDLINLLQSPATSLLVQVIIGCILFIIVFAVFSYIYSLIISDTIKAPSNFIP